LTPKHLHVRYRHQAATAKPYYLNNEDVRSVAADVRHQLAPAVDRYRLTGETLLQIEAIRVNNACLDVCWSKDHPVTNERGEPVLGVCEYDHRGVPDAALISVNPDLTRDKEGLLLGTLAHELGHAIFDVPGWRAIACQTGLPGWMEREPVHRVFQAVSVDEGHLTGAGRKAGDRDFGEWRANEFMGSLLVPRDLLAARLRHHAERIAIPLKVEPEPGLIPLVKESPAIAAYVDRVRFGSKIVILLNNLAADFGVSPRFIQIRLLRYGLATNAQLGLG
jgi:hypothetical protein